MKPLKCEMCGSNDVVKQDGLFVCQFCGTKYSVEEAKKMMIEGTVDVSGSTIKVDRTDSIDNYWEIINAAYKSGNGIDVERYSNKIIEIEPNNYSAWLYKGRAVIMKGDSLFPKLEESANYYVRALECSPEEEKSKILDEAYKTVREAACNAINQGCGIFYNNITINNANTLVSSLTGFLQTYFSFAQRTAVSYESMKNELILLVDNCAYAAWDKVIYPRFLKSGVHLNRIDWAKLLEMGDSLLTLLQGITNLHPNDKQNHARYEKMIHIQRELLSSNSKKYVAGFWVTDLSLDAKSKGYRQNKINEWTSAMQSL